MFLGRPWQVYRDVQYLEESKKYSLVFRGRKHTLVPLTPYQVSGDYKIMREFQEVLKKEEVQKGVKEISFIQEEKYLAQGKDLCVVDDPMSCLKEMDKEHLIVGTFHQSLNAYLPWY